MEMLETLLQGVRSACAAFPDKRRGGRCCMIRPVALQVEPE
jgi:hypothetical protein